MTVEAHNERLTLEKAQLHQVAESRLGILGAIALIHGETKKDGSIELRLTKSKLEAINGYSVRLDQAGKGGLRITLRELEQ